MEMPSPALPLTTRIGMLGAGQLGLMLAQAAADLYLNLHALDGDAEAPARHLVKSFTQSPLTDEPAVQAFGADKDLLTIEIENVSTQALAALEAKGKRIYPQPAVLELIQDKLAQKRFYQEHGIPTAPFREIVGPQELQHHADFLPAYQKLARGGYDGRGVQYLSSIEDAFKALPGPGYLEQPAQPQAELSVIVARTAAGEIDTYPAVESVYYAEANMVDYLVCPARIPAQVEAQAQDLARRVAEAFNVVGLLAVEMFYAQDGKLWVNECAPRPHNTGHHTIEACYTSQYSQMWRALLGLPLGATAMRCPWAATINLIGEDGHQGPAHYQGLEEVLSMPGVYVHLYGKAQTRPFRKMGHVTVLADDYESLTKAIAQVKRHLRVICR